METIESLVAFATDDRIIRIVARERGKFAAKSDGRKEPSESNVLYRDLKRMTPPHRLWRYPGRGKLPKKADRGLACWTRPRKAAAARIQAAIRKEFASGGNAPWARELRSFMDTVRRRLSDELPMELETPVVLPKFKEVDGNGDLVFRPICMYSSLETKVILALTCQYLLTCFDRSFDDSMLFMRSARRYPDGSFRTPCFLDAIDMVEDYRRRCGKRDIYVGECDIRKFYDIFNHEDIMACFEDLFAEAGADSPALFDPVRRVIGAYLNSFDYPRHVLGRNGDSSFWEAERRRHASDGRPDAERRFDWVAEEDFISSGCYTPEEFRQAVDCGHLGIPQGGALSGLIVNVVMRVIDRPLLAGKDPDRLFVRYCDDILLMHTDPRKCADYLHAYHEQLRAHRLVPHPSMPVSVRGKNGRKNTHAFWKQKSKEVYRWGPGAGDASDWVAFVGYEMRRTGEVRLRKDKVDKEMKRIARRYYDVIKSRKAAVKDSLTEAERASLLARFDTLPAHVRDFEKAGWNRYTSSQARRLDDYMRRKARQAARKIGSSDPSAAALSRPTYRQTWREETTKEFDSED